MREDSECKVVAARGGEHGQKVSDAYGADIQVTVRSLLEVIDQTGA